MKLSRLAVAVALGLALEGAQTQAAVVLDIFQSGADVVATGSGTLDLTDLEYIVTRPTAGPGVIPVIGYAEVGPLVAVDFYVGISGPTSFGPGFGRWPIE